MLVGAPGSADSQRQEEVTGAGGVAAASGDLGDPTNADIMARLGTMISRMVVKEDMAVFQKEITLETKLMIAEAVDPLKTTFHGLQDRVSELEKRPTSVLGETGSVDLSL